jgi:hypothetical protein
MITDRVCHRHLVGCRESAGPAVLLDVLAGVRVGVRLDRDPQRDPMLGMTAQLSAPVSPGRAAATDPFLGIPRWGRCAYAGLVGDRGDPDE